VNACPSVLRRRPSCRRRLAASYRRGEPVGKGVARPEDVSARPRDLGCVPQAIDRQGGSDLRNTRSVFSVSCESEGFEIRQRQPGLQGVLEILAGRRVGAALSGSRIQRLRGCPDGGFRKPRPRSLDGGDLRKRELVISSCFSKGWVRWDSQGVVNPAPARRRFSKGARLAAGRARNGVRDQPVADEVAGGHASGLPPQPIDGIIV
jgi:hypothetical protein